MVWAVLGLYNFVSITRYLMNCFSSSLSLKIVTAALGIISLFSKWERKAFVRCRLLRERTPKEECQKKVGIPTLLKRPFIR